MKHQYYGDINDYRKYGLLRILQREAGFRVAVWWMLTPDDNRTDGKFIDYLAAHQRWRAFDPELFDTLVSTVATGRRVTHVRETGLLPNAVLVEEELRSGSSRAENFRRVQLTVEQCDLVFCDPDNGLEVASCPVGRRGAPKYLYWAELVSLYTQGKSVLVYQHFPRVPRGRFIEQLLTELGSRTRSPCILCFATAKVGFFLITQPHHVDAIERGARRVGEVWGDQFRIVSAPGSLQQ